MDLYKAFDCIPHELLKRMVLVKMPYISTFLFSYLKRRKQNVRINNTYSIFQLLLSSVPQGSVLGSILFNLFINDLFMYIKNSDLNNFAYDSTISCV